jgi:hypothetical protein
MRSVARLRADCARSPRRPIRLIGCPRISPATVGIAGTCGKAGARPPKIQDYGPPDRRAFTRRLGRPFSRLPSKNLGKDANQNRLAMRSASASNSSRAIF